MAMPHPQTKYLKCTVFIIYFGNIMLSLLKCFYKTYDVIRNFRLGLLFIRSGVAVAPPLPPSKLRHWRGRGWQNTDNKNNYAFHSPDLSTTFIHVIYKLTAWWHVCQKISHYMYMYITNIPVHNLFSNNTSYEVKDSV